MDAVAPPTQSDLGPSLFKKRSSKNTTIRKRPATPPPASQSDSESSASDNGDGPSLKRRRKNGGVTASSKGAENTTSANLEATKFAADRSTHIAMTNDATKQSNWFDENGHDAMSAKSLLGSSSHSSRAAPASVDGASPGTYRGAANYQTFIAKNATAPIRQVGPIKAPTNIRAITVTDFAPDVCKDYKQTGFCGFGDSCKFLHAREDYKQGWELDRDWEIGTKGKKVGGRTVASANRGGKSRDGDEEDEDEDAVLEGIPFACLLCKRPYANPIVTKCGHYFCEACALQRYRRNPACAACGAGTGGVFNGAKSFRKLLERKRERARKRREKAVENWEEVSEDEGDEGGLVG